MGDRKSYGSQNIYPGMDYGLNPNYGKSFSDVGTVGFGVPSGNFGVPADPRTANQLKSVSDKLSTGIKNVEVSGVQTQILESIPKEHFKEINRLRKLVGAELSFHGPLVEASGFGREGWNEIERKGAESQMWGAVKKSHDLNPKGNVVVTFHSTSGLPELMNRTKTKDGEMVESFIVYDEKSNQTNIVKPEVNHLLDDGKKPSPHKQLEKLNKENWMRELSTLAFHIQQGSNPIKRSIQTLRDNDEAIPDGKGLLDLYKKSKTADWQDIMNTIDNPSFKKQVQEAVNEIHYGETYVRDAYLELQNLFNKAWVAAKKNDSEEDLKRLGIYRGKLKGAMSSTNFDDPQNILEFSSMIQQGANTLNSLSAPPQSFKPMNEFIIDKSSETFSNLALKAYDKFGDSAPIISIENPPAGGGLSRGEDLKKLVEVTRKKFEEKAQKEFGMSKHEAKKEAEKLIGVTWDVGHINMIRKFGYDDKDLIKETEKIAKMTKHIHLSDNFGFEHTELPMGMGDVPLKGHLTAIQKYNNKMKELKQVAETGSWFGPQGFGKSTPFAETLRAFGSPIYAMQMGPAWGSASPGGYFTGYGTMLPEQHFSMYGAGFSNLPTELGGQMGGGRSRFAGNSV